MARERVAQIAASIILAVEMGRGGRKGRGRPSWEWKDERFPLRQAPGLSARPARPARVLGIVRSSGEAAQQLDAPPARPPATRPLSSATPPAASSASDIDDGVDVFNDMLSEVVDRGKHLMANWGSSKAWVRSSTLTAADARALSLRNADNVKAARVVSSGSYTVANDDAILESTLQRSASSGATGALGDADHRGDVASSVSGAHACANVHSPGNDTAAAAAAILPLPNSQGQAVAVVPAIASVGTNKSSSASRASDVASSASYIDHANSASRASYVAHMMDAKRQRTSGDSERNSEESPIMHAGERLQCDSDRNSEESPILHSPERPQIPQPQTWRAQSADARMDFSDEEDLPVMHS